MSRSTSSFGATLQIVLLGLVFLVPSAWSTRSGSPGEEFRVLEAEYEKKIRIHFTADEDLLPKSWRRVTINGKITGISDAELRRFPQLLRKALSRYPKSVITKNLKRIVLLESISFYGLEYGATYSTDTIYLSSKGRDLGYTDRYLIDGFHHEFSSILFRNYRFPSRRWEMCNPSHFSYTGSGVDALRHGQTSLEGSEDLYWDGFLAGYSVSALEEDYNVYSGIAFSQPERLRQLIREYPRVREKFFVWLEFYRSIDPYFTQARVLEPPGAIATIRVGS